MTNIVSTIYYINSVIQTVFLSLVENFNSNAKDFISFLSANNIVSVCLGLIFATQITNLNNMLINEIITPIMLKITDKQKISDYKHTILGIEFNTGKIIMNMFNIFFIILFVYILYTVMQKGITEFMQDISTIIKL